MIKLELVVVFVWVWNIDKSVELKFCIVVKILCEVLIFVSVVCEVLLFVYVVCVEVVLDDEDVELKGCMQTEQLYS